MNNRIIDFDILPQLDTIIVQTPQELLLSKFPPRTFRSPLPVRNPQNARKVPPRRDENLETTGSPLQAVLFPRKLAKVYRWAPTLFRSSGKDVQWLVPRCFLLEANCQRQVGPDVKNSARREKGDAVYCRTRGREKGERRKGSEGEEGPFS